MGESASKLTERLRNRPVRGNGMVSVPDWERDELVAALEQVEKALREITLLLPDAIHIPVRSEITGIAHRALAVLAGQDKQEAT